MRLLVSPARLALALGLSTLVAASAGAAPCPTVMIILDRSGSMDADPAGDYGSPPTKMDIAKIALNKLVMQYGDRLPFGFTSFASTGIACSDGVQVVVKPKNGTRADVTAAITATVTEGSTNTGPSVDAVNALPEMHDDARPGSYILLVTDGEPNCAGTVGTESTDPAYTVGAIKRAAVDNVKTFVIGFGALPASAKTAMNMMATAGEVPCSGAACNGQLYYSAEDDAGLQAAIDSISKQIFGEFGGQCDDSCYANGCMNAGEICVAGKCKADPCAQVRANCAPADYCYTDGVSPGTCTPQCPPMCPAGQSCSLAGCAADPCATVTCDASKVCQGGACVPLTCTPECAQNLFCIGGKCKDDPCRFLQCPTGSVCTPLVGTCVATTGTGSGGNHARDSGCHFAPGAHADQALMLFALVSLITVMRLSRRRRSL